MSFRKDDIIILLGAGASADAGIPVSSKMIEELEKELLPKNEWDKFKDLYFLIKSAYNYSRGIVNKESNFNIEVLVNILRELQKKEEHPLYPFIGSWNVKFDEVVKDDFSLIRDFEKKILEQLKKWVSPANFKNGKYLKKIYELKQELNFSLKIFSLNYDLLFEKNVANDSNEVKIEIGFDKETRKWNHKLFLESEPEPDFNLYKLHGSINWERDNNTQEIKYTDSIPAIPDLIFGTQYKLQYVDPYLFLISEFRHYTLNSKLIICMGYSFSDEHINVILSQSLKSNKDVILYSISLSQVKDNLLKQLNLDKNYENRINIENYNIKTFLENNELKLEKLKKFIKEQDDSISF